MYVIRLSQRWTGLCNQLFALANGIANKPAGIDTVYITGFAPDLGSTLLVPASKIIDLTATGKKLGVTLKDHSEKNRRGGSSFGWYTRDTAKFNMVLRCITFNKRLVDLSEEIFPGLVQDPSVSVVHLRIEADGLLHWSKQNKMPLEGFKQALYNHYRTIIKKHIPVGSCIIALTYDTGSPLIQELAKDYHVVQLDSKELLQRMLGFSGREACAVLDLLLGERCNNVFVGCHNFKLNRGSTFSYTLWQRMSKVKKGVFIDLDGIKNPPQIKN